MRVIGFTGGVGAGKSALLSYIRQHYNSRILLADEAGNLVKEPGQPCYEQLVRLLGEGLLDGEGRIDRGKMAARIFADKSLLAKVNAIIHPAVEAYIMEQIRAEREAGKVDFFFVEAALLIECGYEDKLDEIWYIHADMQVRRARLKRTRGYSEEKIGEIMASQLTEKAFRRHCPVVIDNSGKIEEAYRQIDERLKVEVVNGK